MPPRIVVGLGNPGRRYEQTRHNVGFLVVDELARRWDIDCSKKQLGSEVGSGLVRDVRTVLAKPQQYMNRSGHPARSLVGFYKSEVEDVVAIHDEVDLPFGTVRVKRGGGAGGHKGLRSLDQHFTSREYARVRVGVSRPPEGWDTADYVLGKWNAAERDDLEVLVGRAADAVELVLADGVPAAMNRFNVRPKKPRKPSEADPETGPGDGAGPVSSFSIPTMQAVMAAGV